MNSLLEVEAAVQRGKFGLRAKFAAPLDGVTVVFGPSGAGKSMLLSAVAGLTRLAGGKITLNGRVLDDTASGVRVATHARGIGMLFQDARLFPHLSVRGNLRYADRRRPVGKPAMSLEDVAKRFEVFDLLDRPVRNLSGGEKSRVALARALLSAPDVLLLDEPFAALDGARRRAFIALLGEISREQKLPMMVVTHLIEDAAELGNFVVGLKDGEVVAAGPAKETMASAAFQALLDARDVGARVDGAVVASGQQRRGVWVRADNVLLAATAPHGLSARNVWAGTVADVRREAGGSVLVSVSTDAGYVLSRITPEAETELAFKTGSPAWAVVKTHAL